MPEFEMPTAFDDLPDAKVAPTAVYKFIVTRQEICDNKKMTGKNLEIDLTLTDDPQYEGIRQTIWLSLPGEADKGIMTKQAQPLAAMKQKNLEPYIIALGGTIRGNKFSLPENAMCKATLVKKMSEEGRPFNRIEGALIPLKGEGKKVS